MFARVKKSGKYQYLQLVENRKEKGRVKQQVIATLGRMDELSAKGRVQTLIRSLSRFSEQAMLIISGKSDVALEAKKIGPALIFERLWEQAGIGQAIRRQAAERKFGFDVERAVFLTVLHRLMVSGSDRFCERWQRDYLIEGMEGIELQHLYRAMGFLGEEFAEQKQAVAFAPRCTKDRIEEEIFFHRRDLFSELDLVFFDTTSLYFEGAGGESIGQRGFSKDHRPDLKQMVLGVVIDDKGLPICCEMWPGNTADVKSLLPVVESIRTRFAIRSFCIVADRGMISAETLLQLESPDSPLPYILGVRMRKLKVMAEVLSRAGRFQEIYPDGRDSKDPSPLSVKQVVHNGDRYIVCFNPRQARKDAQQREQILSALSGATQAGGHQPGGQQGLPTVSEDRQGSRTDR